MSATYVDLTTNARAAAPQDGRKYSNGARTMRNGYAGEGTARLTHTQKARLCAEAARAFAMVHGRRQETTAELEAWRRAEQRQAVGIESLTTCTQQHYNALLAHFADLSGESGVAMNAHVADATAERRVALHKLNEACTERGLTLAYPTPICRARFKCALEDATAKQLWQLAFTVRSSKHPVLPKAARAARLGAGPLPPKLTITKTGTKPKAPEIDEPF